jgi:polyisoprenoid-binding protein YceI
MKTTHLFILAIAIFASACSDPAANKPKAQTSEPVAKALSNRGSETAPGGGLPITPENSKVEFTGSKVTGKHEGGFKQFNGTIDLIDDRPETSGVIIDIDMASVFTDADGLTTHLLSGDFFDVRRFPRSTFVSNAIAPDAAKGTGNYNVTGDLEMRGVKKTITFPATITVTPADVTVNAEFSINRKDFGIVYAGQADNLIRDDVAIRLDLKAAKK